MNPNVISVAYAILKIPRDKPFICCITFACIYNKSSTLIILINNYTMSSYKFFIFSVFESYIMQCKSSMVTCIRIKVQWLLFMKIFCRHLDKYLCMVCMIVYVCCWYSYGSSFLTYNICIVVAICWSFNHLQGFRRKISSLIDNWKSSFQ